MKEQLQVIRDGLVLARTKAEDDDVPGLLSEWSEGFHRGRVSGLTQAIDLLDTVLKAAKEEERDED